MREHLHLTARREKTHKDEANIHEQLRIRINIYTRRINARLHVRRFINPFRFFWLEKALRRNTKTAKKEEDI